MAQDSKSDTSNNTIEEQLKVIREDIAQLAEAVKLHTAEDTDKTAKASQGKARQSSQQSANASGEATTDFGLYAESVEAFIKQNPSQSAFMALLIGLVVGCLFQR